MNKKLFHISLVLLTFSCNRNDATNVNSFKQEDSENHTKNIDNNSSQLGTNQTINRKRPKINLSKTSVYDNFLSIYLPVDFRLLNANQESIPYFGKQNCKERYGNQDASVSFSIYLTKKRMTDHDLDSYVMKAGDTLETKNECISGVKLNDASFDELTIRTIRFYFWINDNYVYYRVGFTLLKNKLVLFIFKATEDKNKVAEQTAEIIFRSIKLKQITEYGDKKFSF